MVVGKLGHINTAGMPKAPAHSFSRYNPLFIESLETGVRPLVVALINRFDCATFSSCEGHFSEDGTSITSLRTVGFLHGNEGECAYLQDELNTLIQSTHGNWQGTARFALSWSLLNTDSGQLRCLELVLDPNGLSAAHYFAEADELCGTLIGLLNMDDSRADPR
jgi:hypothetical protein